MFPVLDWSAAITAHIPNKGEQLVRYYGYYSNVSRGKRRQKPEGEEGVSRKPEVIEVDPPPISKELKKRWSYFIQKVYETAHLYSAYCPRMLRPGRDRIGRDGISEQMQNPWGRGVFSDPFCIFCNSFLSRLSSWIF